MVFSHFCPLGALGRWLGRLHRPPPPPAARGCWVSVFLWFSHIFAHLELWAGGLCPSTGRRRPPAAGPLFSFGFLTFLPTWSSGPVACAPPPAAAVRRLLGLCFPLVFSHFCPLGALGRWLVPL